jgi:hypothetical protein
MPQEINQEQTQKRRKDAGILQITERDIAALTWIAEQSCISYDHLRQLLGRQAKAATKTQGILSISATRDTITRWLQLGLVEEPRKIISGFPPHIWLSRKGITQLSLPYAYYLPKPASIPHIYAVNTIRLYLESYHLQSTWYPQRALTRQTEQRPQPDGELRAGRLPIAALQVIEKPIRLDITLYDALDELTQLAERRSGSEYQYSALWYFCHPEAKTAIQEALTTRKTHLKQRTVFYNLNAEPADAHNPT